MKAKGRCAFQDGKRHTLGAVNSGHSLATRSGAASRDGFFEGTSASQLAFAITDHPAHDYGKFIHFVA
jgi:hypothetical protein